MIWFPTRAWQALGVLLAHSEKNSITRISRSARTFFTARKAACTSGGCSVDCGLTNVLVSEEKSSHF